MNLKHFIQKTLWKFGVDVQKFSPGLNVDYVHTNMLARYNIDLVLDVGANIGQFGQQLRNNYEYAGRLISFEPIQEAREKLEKLAAADGRWEVISYALGDVSGSQMLNVSENSQSSSILPMHPRHVIAAPSSRYVKQQRIEVKRLDEIFADLGAEGRNVFLKLDVQGYEMKVLAGAAESLKKIRAVRLEMSIRPLYESELLIEDLIAYMRRLDFHLIAIEPNFTEPATGALLQVDGLFCRL